MMTLLMRFITSRLGLAAMIAALLWGWHVYDKRQALAAARDGYVRAVEMSAIKAELEETKRRARVSSEALDRLSERLQVADAEADRIAREIERYEAENQVNPSCAIDGAIFDRLRGN